MVRTGGQHRRTIYYRVRPPHTTTLGVILLPVCEVSMTSHEKWENFKQGVIPINHPYVDLRAQKHRLTVEENYPRRSVLAEAIAAALYRQQSANLISRIYSLSGDGRMPIPGGRMELRTRNRLFKR